MAGEDTWGVVIFYVREDWLKFWFLAQSLAEQVRAQKFVQALGQLLCRHSPNEISHCARLREPDAIDAEDHQSSFIQDCLEVVV